MNEEYTSALEGAPGPGSVVDLDFGVVKQLAPTGSDLGAWAFVGIAVDGYSGAPVGMVVTLEEDQVELHRKLVENILSDKVKFCSKYGMTISGEEWPIHHVPQSILSDQPKGLRKFMEQTSNALHITWRKRPVGPPQKGSAEHLVALVTKQLEGTEGDAHFTLIEVAQRVITVLLKVLHSSIPRGDARHKQMGEGTNPTPLDLWNWGMENTSGPCPPASDDMRRKLSRGLAK